MLDAGDALLSDEFQAVDLACGPGSLSQRLLDRFPRVRCIAIDLDPVLLAVGRGALEEAGFIEVGTIWQNMDNRVLMAIR